MIWKKGQLNKSQRCCNLINLSALRLLELEIEIYFAHFRLATLIVVGEGKFYD